LLLPVSGTFAASPSPLLDLSAFQGVDGALALHPGGKDCDPYFAMKALAIAERFGMDVSVPALRFATWLQPKQRVDGGFDRFRRNGPQWEFFAGADADDSTTALWMQTLCITKLVTSEYLSFERAGRLLASLRIPIGTYSIAPDNPVQLLMDNCEVYESLRVCARFFRQAGNPPIAEQLGAQADSLRPAITRQFRQNKADHWRVSSQQLPDQSFYPQAAAQLFPLLGGLEPASNARSARLPHWLSKYGQTWLSGTADEFPWGLLACAFAIGKNRPVVERWLAFAAPFRASGTRWNILEEACWQALSQPAAPIGVI
jgi:hypothetical protein